MRSSRIYVVDTKPHPTQAKIHKIIEPEELFKKTGYSGPHTIHLVTEGIDVSTLGGGGKDGTDGPLVSSSWICETFDILGRWEIYCGPSEMKHDDFWWNLPRDYMVSSEWALPPQFENGSRSGGPSLQQVWPSHPLLGSASPAQCPDYLSWLLLDGARGAARA